MKEIKVGEIIKYKDVWLKAIEHESCNKCFFKSENCFKTLKEIHCRCYSDNAISFEEISEIEALVLQGDKNENS